MKLCYTTAYLPCFPVIVLQEPHWSSFLCIRNTKTNDEGCRKSTKKEESRGVERSAPRETKERKSPITFSNPRARCMYVPSLFLQRGLRSHSFVFLPSFAFLIRLGIGPRGGQVPFPCSWWGFSCSAECPSRDTALTWCRRRLSEWVRLSESALFPRFVKFEH